MTGVHLDAVPELDEPTQRVEEALGSLPPVDCEVGPRSVADEERVAGEDDPRVCSARPVSHCEAAVLGPMAGRVDAAKDDVAENDLVVVLHRVVRVLGCGCRMDAHRNSVLECESPVTREMISVRVRLDCANDADLATLGLLEVLLDREGRIDDDGLAGARIADEIRRTPERVVDELREDHGRARPYQRRPLFLLKCAAQATTPGEHRDCDDREHTDERYDTNEGDALRRALLGRRDGQRDRPRDDAAVRVELLCLQLDDSRLHVGLQRHPETELRVRGERSAVPRRSRAVQPTRPSP